MTGDRECALASNGSVREEAARLESIMESHQKDCPDPTGTTVEADGLGDVPETPASISSALRKASNLPLVSNQNTGIAVEFASLMSDVREAKMAAADEVKRSLALHGIIRNKDLEMDQQRKKVEEAERVQVHNYTLENANLDLKRQMEELNSELRSQQMVIRIRNRDIEDINLKLELEQASHKATMADLSESSDQLRASQKKIQEMDRELSVQRDELIRTSHVAARVAASQVKSGTKDEGTVPVTQHLADIKYMHGETCRLKEKVALLERQLQMSDELKNHFKTIVTSTPTDSTGLTAGIKTLRMTMSPPNNTSNPLFSIASSATSADNPDAVDKPGAASHATGTGYKKAVLSPAKATSPVRPKSARLYEIAASTDSNAARPASSRATLGPGSKPATPVRLSLAARSSPSSAKTTPRPSAASLDFSPTAVQAAARGGSTGGGHPSPLAGRPAWGGGHPTTSTPRRGAGAPSPTKPGSGHPTPTKASLVTTKPAAARSVQLGGISVAKGTVAESKGPKFAYGGGPAMGKMMSAMDAAVAAATEAVSIPNDIYEAVAIPNDIDEASVIPTDIDEAVASPNDDNAPIAEALIISSDATPS